jgi:polyphosphate kinase 2
MDSFIHPPGKNRHMTQAKPRKPAARTAASKRAKRVQPVDREPVRLAVQGDTAPSTRPRALEEFVVNRATLAAQDKAVAAALELVKPDAAGTPGERAQLLRALLEGASSDDQKVLRKALLGRGQKFEEESNPDEELAGDWREGGYPYKNLLRRSTYEKEKFRLQVELLKLQAWAKETGQRIVILFEGRDAAGKGGTIKRFMEHLNPRGARVVALEKPSPSEQGQWYFQRYVQHLPSHGEIVMFDRSWYNRAGVERVMGFCSDAEYAEFMRQAPEFERHLVRSGVHLIKFWFSVSPQGAAPPLQGTRRPPAQALEAQPHRPGLAGQVGGLHPGQGSDVLRDRHRRFALDRDQERLQEARAPERHALHPAQAALHQP